MEEIKNRTNCPNCGAALPQFGGKCEFCGTRVVDLTMLDFDTREPTMFLLNLPRSVTSGQKATIDMWARPELNAINMETNYVDVYGSWGNQKLAALPQIQVGFEITLRPCAKPDMSLFALKVDN